MIHLLGPLKPSNVASLPTSLQGLRETPACLFQMPPQTVAVTSLGLGRRRTGAPLDNRPWLLTQTDAATTNLSRRYHFTHPWTAVFASSHVMFSWTHTQTSLNLSNFPLATAQVPPGVRSGWKASFLLFHSGLVVRSSQHTCCCCSPTLSHHPLHPLHPRGSMFSPILLVARSASALARSPTFVFLASSLRLVISVFSQPSSLSHLGLGGGWVGGWVWGGGSAA